MKKNMTAILGIIFIGAIWGILEATMGNVLHWIGLHPYTGAIMTSIALGLLAFGRKLYHKRGSSIVMGVIASGIKAFDLLIPGSNVIRPIVAIMVVAIAHEAIMLVTDKMTEKNYIVAARGLVAGYLSIAGFAFSAAYILHHNYWLGMGASGIFKYLLTDGWYFGLGSMLLVLGGHYLVKLGNTKINLDKIVLTKPYLNASIAGTCLVIILAVIV